MHLVLVQILLAHYFPYKTPANRVLNLRVPFETPDLVQMELYLSRFFIDAPGNAWKCVVSEILLPGV